jgi:L,D-transpeptidase catalytic domain
MTRHLGPLVHAALIVALAGLVSRRADAQAVPPGSDIRAAAASSNELRVVVSVGERRLWTLGADGDTLLAAPVAVGSGRRLRSGSQVWSFNTPRGVRTVISKEIDPLWIRPDWAYVEVAREHHLRLDSVSVTRSRPLPDGRTLIVRGRVVGTLWDSSFVEWPEDDEIVIGDVLYIPPIGSEQRSVPGVLGAYRLNLGDGLGIHGTPEKESIGRAVTHGCLRLNDADLDWLFRNVPVGTRVFIY